MTAAIDVDDPNLIAPPFPMDDSSSEPSPPETLSSTITTSTTTTSTIKPLEDSDNNNNNNNNNSKIDDVLYNTDDIDDIDNGNYTLPPCPMPPRAELEVVESFVMSAVLSQHEASPSAAAVQGYTALIDAVRRLEDPEMVRNVFIALRTAGNGNCFRYLTRYPEIHAHLNHLLFKTNSVTAPYKMREAEENGDKDHPGCEIFDNGSLLDAHMHLILAFVSAKSVSTVPALTWVWKMMIHRSSLPQPISYRLHAMLVNMLRLIPRARSDLFPILASCAPFWKRKKDHMEWYFTQCFKVATYLPSIRKQLLELIIDKCLEIDVHIKIEENGNVLIDKEEEEENENEEGVADTTTTTTTDENNETDKATDDLAILPDEVPSDESAGATSTSTNSTNTSDEEAKVEIAPLMTPEEPEYPNEIAELSDKLDSLLVMILETIQTQAIDRRHTRGLYYEISPIFESTILTTHKSKFVQFCMFYCCALESEQQQEQQSTVEEETTAEVELDGQISQSQQQQLQLQQQPQHAILHRDFAAKQLGIVFDPYRATLTRQSGACYVASFVSRASYVGPETVCETVSALLRWAESYATSTIAYRAADAREQTELHSLFYTVCQAAFYIMCFRGGEAMEFYEDALQGYKNRGGCGDKEEEEEEDPALAFLPDPEHIDLSSKRWTYLCSHPLQPLRFCLESVRSEFLHLAHAFDLIEERDFDTLVKDAKRMSTGRVNKKAASSIMTAATLEKRRQNGGVGGLGRGSNPLKSFFPFDPLLLSRSHEFIEPFYKHWQGPVEDEDVLVIDDGGEEDEDGVFEMDDEDTTAVDGDDSTRHDASMRSTEDSPVIVSDHERKETDEARNVKFSSLKISAKKKEEQRKAWKEATKRPRSQSLDNGSW